MRNSAAVMVACLPLAGRPGGDTHRGQEKSWWETRFEVVQECLKKLFALLYVSFYQSFKMNKTSGKKNIILT